MSVGFEATGELEAQREAIAAVLAIAAGVEPAAVAVTIDGDKVSADITVAAEAADDTAGKLSAGLFASRESLQAALKEGGVADVEVVRITSGPEVTQLGDDTGSGGAAVDVAVAVGVAVAAVVVLLLCGIGLFCWRRRRKRAGATTTTATARKGKFAESQMVNVGPPPPGVAPPPAGMPPNWEQCVDPTSNEVYYYNASTGETQWALPTS